MTVDTPAGDRLVRLDRNEVGFGSEEILLFACLRNEELRLPFFLDYYRRLGVSRFFLLDNDSTDGTASLLLSHSDVHAFYTDGSYSRSRCGVLWLNGLLRRFAATRWALVVDADELLVYPDCENVPLPALVRRLDATGSEALLTFLLDMYAAGPIREARYHPGTPFVDTCPYFDSDSYTPGAEGMRARIPATGGVRRRLFWPSLRDGRANPPFLAKVPLVKWSPEREYLASTHLIEGVRLAGCTGVLLHFKLFSDFVAKAVNEAERREHWDGAAQYAVYAAALAARPDLDPMYGGSVRFRDSRQLVELGLMIE